MTEKSLLLRDARDRSLSLALFHLATVGASLAREAQRIDLSRGNVAAKSSKRVCSRSINTGSIAIYYFTLRNMTDVIFSKDEIISAKIAISDRNGRRVSFSQKASKVS